MSELTPWSARMREILADGQWHTREELVAKVGPLIPPGRAMRQRERAAAHSNSRNNGDQREPSRRGSGPKPTRSEDYYIGIGRRSLIVEATQSRAFEKRMDDGGVTWLRLRPQPKEDSSAGGGGQGA